VTFWEITNIAREDDTGVLTDPREMNPLGIVTIADRLTFVAYLERFRAKLQ